MPTVTQIGQVVQSTESQQRINCALLKATVAQSSAEAEVYALTSAANNRIHLQSVIIGMGIDKSAEGIKLHLHTDSASSNAMVSKLGMLKKSTRIEFKYLHLQDLIESGLITVHKVGIRNKPSDVLTKFMPPSTPIKNLVTICQFS
eukprot:4271614-Amphidinium_carterae.1